MTLKHAQAELKTKQAEVKKMDGGYKKDQDTLQAVKSSKEKLEAELAKLNYEGTAAASRLYSYRQLFCMSYLFFNNVRILCVSVCLQMVKRRVCWTEEGSCPERSLSLKRPMRDLCLVSPTCASTTSKDLPN